MDYQSLEYIERRIAAGNDLSPQHGERLLAEIEALKVQARNFRDVAKENRELVDLIAKAENQLDTSRGNEKRCCESIGRLAQLCGMVVPLLLLDYQVDLTVEQRLAAEEIMDYVDAVRPR